MNFQPSLENAFIAYLTYEAFVENMNACWDEGREKEAALLAGEYPEFYEQYFEEWG